MFWSYIYFNYVTLNPMYIHGRCHFVSQKSDVSLAKFREAFSLPLTFIFLLHWSSADSAKMKGYLNFTFISWPDHSWHISCSNSFKIGTVVAFSKLHLWVELSPNILILSLTWEILTYLSSHPCIFSMWHTKISPAATWFWMLGSLQWKYTGKRKHSGCRK